MSLVKKLVINKRRVLGLLLGLFSLNVSAVTASGFRVEARGINLSDCVQKMDNALQGKEKHFRIGLFSLLGTLVSGTYFMHGIFQREEWVLKAAQLCQSVDCIEAIQHSLTALSLFLNPLDSLYNFLFLNAQTVSTLKNYLPHPLTTEQVLACNALEMIQQINEKLFLAGVITTLGLGITIYSIHKRKKAQERADYYLKKVIDSIDEKIRNVIIGLP